MRLKPTRALFLMFALTLCLLSAAPAFGSWYGKCEKCSGGYDPETQTVVSSCVEPEDEEWGSEQCRINCGKSQDPEFNYFFCRCDDTYLMCMFIKVTPSGVTPTK